MKKVKERCYWLISLLDHTFMLYKCCGCIWVHQSVYVCVWCCACVRACVFLFWRSCSDWLLFWMNGWASVLGWCLWVDYCTDYSILEVKFWEFTLGPSPVTPAHKIFPVWIYIEFLKSKRKEVTCKFVRDRTFHLEVLEHHVSSLGIHSTKACLWVNYSSSVCIGKYIVLKIIIVIIFNNNSNILKLCLKIGMFIEQFYRNTLLLFFK